MQPISRTLEIGGRTGVCSIVLIAFSCAGMSGLCSAGGGLADTKVSEDSVLQAVRNAREAYARSHAHDAREIVADLRKRETTAIGLL